MASCISCLKNHCLPRKSPQNWPKNSLGLKEHSHSLSRSPKFALSTALASGLSREHGLIAWTFRRTAHADEGPSGAAPSKAAPLLQPPFYPVCEVSTAKSCRFCTFSTVGDSAMDHHVRTSHPDTVNLKWVEWKYIYFWPKLWKHYNSNSN